MRPLGRLVNAAKALRTQFSHKGRARNAAIGAMTLSDLTDRRCALANRSPRRTNCIFVREGSRINDRLFGKRSV
jgi:hypothetical protein